MSTSTTSLTIAEYDQLIATGYFERPGEPRWRVELIEGELRDMSPIGSLHEEILDLLVVWSTNAFRVRPFRLRVQNSIGLPSLATVPQPDIAWVVEKSYRYARPTAEDVALLIEVADSSLHFDLGHKATLYAAAGITDYWVVNIPEQCLEIHRQPQNGTYTVISRHGIGDAAQPLCLPEVNLPVNQLFPPQ